MGAGDIHYDEAIIAASAFPLRASLFGSRQLHYKIFAKIVKNKNKSKNDFSYDFPLVTMAHSL